MIVNGQLNNGAEIPMVINARITKSFAAWISADEMFARVPPVIDIQFSAIFLNFANNSELLINNIIGGPRTRI